VRGALQGFCAFELQPRPRRARHILKTCKMPPHGFIQAAIVAAVFFLAGAVKGMTGMGLPTVAMGGLGAFMAPVEAASLLVVPSFVTNVWQLLAGPSLAKLAARLSLMLVGIVIGTVAGARMLTGADTVVTTVGLGVALALYAAIGLLAPPFCVPRRAQGWLSPLIGVATGLVTGGTGVFVIPAVPYLQALALDRDDLIQALGLSFTVSTVALAIGLARGGAFHLGELAASALAVVPAALGMWSGQVARRRISPVAFRRYFLVCLFLLGGELALRPLM
jgi:uncharacterized protein